MVGLLVLMRRKLGGLEGRRVLRGVLQSLAGALAMGLALTGWMALAQDLPAWLITVGGLLLGGLVYGLSMLALGVPETRALINAVQRRLR